MHAFTRKTGKLFLTLLAVAALLFVVTACRGGDDPSPSPPPAVTPGPGGAATPAPTPTPEPPPSVDPSQPPRTIRITSWYEHSMGGGVPTSEPDLEEANDPEQAMKQWNHRLWMEEHYNVRFEHISTGEYEEHREAFLAGQFAGSPIGDMVLLSGSMIVPAYQGGHVHDFNGLNFAGSDLFGAREFIQPATELGGGIWSVSHTQPGNQAFFLGYNVELGRRLGVPDPVELYNTGNWTFDAFLSMARTAGQAGPNSFGVSGVIRDVATGLIAANDGRMADDNFNYAFDHPNTMEALSLFATLWQEELFWFDREAPSEQFNDWWANMTAYANSGDDILFFCIETWVPGMIGHNDIEFRVLPFPRGPSNTSGNTNSRNFLAGITIPQGVEDPVFIHRLIQEAYSWVGDEMWRLEEAARSWPSEVFFTDDCVTRMLDIANNRVVFDPGWPADLDGTTSDIAGDIHTGTRTLAESVEYHRGPAQERLDAVFRS